MKNSYIYIFVQEIFADFWLTRRGRSNGEATIGVLLYGPILTSRAYIVRKKF